MQCSFEALFYDEECFKVSLRFLRSSVKKKEVSLT